MVLITTMYSMYCKVTLNPYFIIIVVFIILIVVIILMVKISYYSISNAGFMVIISVKIVVKIILVKMVEKIILAK